MSKILEIENLHAGYSHKEVLRNINLTVKKGDFLGIIGPNGGGKSTLLKVILGLIKPSKGKVSFFLNGARQEQVSIGYLPQISNIDKEFPISVRELVLSGLPPKNTLFSTYSIDQLKEADHIIEKIGLSDHAKHPISRLSGGQFQRVLLGRAIISNPDILILDEPNSYLDREFEIKLYDILKEINETTTILLVSHNISAVRSISKSIACVNGNLHYHPNNTVSADCLYDSFLV
ncbi:MAG: metal ABC transporter ATP-binding protein [Bacteroidales bacterium]